MVSFLNMFMSYLLVFVVFAVCIIASVFAGIAVRKNKNKKAATEVVETSTEE